VSHDDLGECWLSPVRLRIPCLAICCNNLPARRSARNRTSHALRSASRFCACPNVEFELQCSPLSGKIFVAPQNNQPRRSGACYCVTAAHPRLKVLQTVAV
jgi:hypothetical protein